MRLSKITHARLEKWYCWCGDAERAKKVYLSVKWLPGGDDKGHGRGRTEKEKQWEPTAWGEWKEQ